MHVLCDPQEVSIHAPAWGATAVLLVLIKMLAVSIHAPAWGATNRNRLGRHALPSFNPRSRVGSDLFPHLGHPLQCRFNPRSRVGSDVPHLSIFGGGVGFQSTLPRGERRSYTRTDDAKDEFQSTLPRGERLTWGRMS